MVVVAAIGAAVTNADGLAKKTLPFSESGNVYSVSTGKARTLLDPLVIEWVIKATVRKPICRQTPVTFRISSRK